MFVDGRDCIKSERLWTSTPRLEQSRGNQADDSQKFRLNVTERTPLTTSLSPSDYHHRQVNS
jgi:hypothetical protein